ncbi:uncharacterized protein B0J16DRAFT_349281 [Fusarium flagelliforme]|uniref:uncharacterized protein n=1 Tax=Fusarium flagelliforme TaxID=2675880 RepID=UPI001E8DCA99|nr:uncharacterized protein B0J16DRAFT_349281 [Fusarium flagelliforme]KAH7174854.1 hypothetical protein B0J16DRAFT_349281 [Fusarium flagelliforme]
MRGLTLWPILIIAISLCDLIHAENYRLQDVPRCAINCLDKSLEEPTFSDANISRLCSVTAISNEVLACVRGDCSVKDLLEYMRTECKACNRPDIDNDHNIRAINFFILGAILVSVGIRIWTKLCRFTKWGTDDYLIIPAAILTAVQTICMSLMTWVGLGHDIWTISEETTTRFFIYLLVVEFTYVLSLCLIKLSILFFFLRIFPDPTFIKIIRWTIGFTILTTTVILILACLQSAPTEPSQEGWDGAPESGPRLNIQALILSHAGINVALDVWMFILPLTQLYNLGLKARKKIGIMLMFSVGIFLIAVSCIRIPSMRDFNKTLNATSDSQGIIVWSNIETGVGILVACMPHTQPLLHAAKAQIRWLNILPSTSSSAQGIFVERSLVPIKITAIDGTTATRPEELILYDRGGLLSADRPESAKKASHRSNGVETV